MLAALRRIERVSQRLVSTTHIAIKMSLRSGVMKRGGERPELSEALGTRVHVPLNRPPHTCFVISCALQGYSLHFHIAEHSPSSKVCGLISPRTVA